MWYDLENARVRYQVLKFTTEMIKNGMIFDKDPAAKGAVPVTLKTESVKKWMASEKVQFSKVDNDLWEGFFKIINEYQNIKKNDDVWTSCTDEETRRVLYRKEEGGVFTFLTDTIINSPAKNTVACFENLEILQDMFPTFKEVKWLKRQGDQSGLAYFRQ